MTFQNYKQVIIASIIIFNCFLISTTVLAHEYDFERDWSLEYDACAGTIKVKFLYYFDDSNDDFIDYIRIDYKDQNNNWIRFFRFEDIEYSGNEYRFNEAPGGKGFWWDNGSFDADFFNEGQTGNKFFVSVVLKQIPSNLFGQNIHFRIRGKWNEGGGVDQEFEEITKNISTQAITAPRNVSATTDRCNKVIVSWDDPDNLPCTDRNKWKILVDRRSFGSNESWVFLGESRTNEFKDSTANTIDGKEYEYRIISLFEPNAHIDDYSNHTAARKGNSIEAPGQPQNLILTPVCERKIELSWTPSGGEADTFIINKANCAFCPVTRITLPVSNNTVNTNMYLDTGHVAGAFFVYSVKAKNICQDSSINSSVKSLFTPSKPNAITNLQVTTDSINNRINLTWTDNANNESDYRIQRELLKNNSKVTFTLSPNSTSFIDATVNACEEYEYIVSPINLCQPDGNFIDAPKHKVYLNPNLSNTFSSNALDASKGYFPDKVELTWNNINQNVINRIKIYRRVLESNDTNYVLIATLSDGAGVYNDLFAEASILYQYKIQAEANCGTGVSVSNFVETVGFRSRTGIVTGQVNYAGGIAVKDVRITAEASIDSSGGSIQFNGSNLRIESATSLSPNAQLAIESWIRPTGYTQNFTLVERQNQYKLEYVHSSSIYKFTIYKSGPSGLVSKAIDIQATLIPLNSFSHILVQAGNDSLQCYINGLRVIGTNNTLSPFTFNSVSNPINIGVGFSGQMDEMRIWNSTKSKETILRDYTRILNGNEEGLKVYLRFDEGKGKSAYDISKSNNQYLKHHAHWVGTNLSWSSIKPGSSQLSYTSYTNELGNYILPIPFSGSGQAFILTPSYLTHQFAPSTTSLFIGDESLIHNNVNFVDKSSFRIQGSVVFNGTNCGVGDVLIRLDGVPLISGGGQAKTDPTGAFDIQVPIGDHYIELEKAGHIFNVGRFPSAGTFNFQEPLAGLLFKDSTLIKIAGRVVGGQREATKIHGFSKSINNIGVAQIILKSQLGNGCVTDTINTDSISGEYIVYLPPMKYIPSVKIPSNPTIDFGVLDLIDLTGTPETLTDRDTIRNLDGDIIDIITFNYNKKLDYIYRVKPVLNVKSPDGVNEFIGDSLYTYINRQANDTTIVNLSSDPFRWPILSQGDPEKLYRMLIWVYEPYIRYDVIPNKTDSVPNIDGKIRINNELATVSDVELELSQFNDADSIRTLIYSFAPGTPNFNENLSIPAYSFTRKLQIDLVQTSGDVISWQPVPDHLVPIGGDKVFRAYLLGTISNGTQFVIFGPQVPDYILRDPPGSASTATREIGSTKTDKTSWSWDFAGEASTKDKSFVGSKFVTGVGVAIETDVKLNGSVGFKASLGGGNNGEQAISIENTREWSTYGGIVIQPGATSDLYVGRSRNMQFGIAQELIIFPEHLCTQVECLNAAPAPDFSLGKRYGLSMIPDGFETTFLMSEYDLINFTIPNLKSLRNLILQNNTRYISHLGTDEDNYGLNNDDPVFPNPSTTTPDIYEFEDLDGPSYQFQAMTYEDSLEVDSVRLLNNQIKLWEESIRLNEWEKVNIDNQDAIDSLRNVQLDALEEEYSEVIAAYSVLVIASVGSAGVIAYGLIANPIPGTAIAGVATFAVTTATSIALAELQEEFDTYLAKKQRINDKFDQLGIGYNFTLSGGTNLKSSITHGSSSSYNRKLEYSVNTEIAAAAEGKINNTGVGFEKSLSFTFNSSREWSQEESEKETVSFELNDPDIGDLMSVDVYPSILGWGPIFKLKAGGHTSCPHEHETVTQFYEPGTLISERTLQIDKPTISASPIKQTNIPADQPAVFNLTLSNESEIGFIMGYDVSVVSATNPFGAIVRIDGLAGQSVIIPGGTSINKLLTIAKGPGPVYKYDSILVVISSQCQYTGGAGFNTDIVDSVYLSAHFIPSCTNIDFATPDDKWILNNYYNNILPLAIDDYNYNYFDFEKFRIQYKPSNQSEWIGLETFHKDTNGLHDPQAKLIPDVTPFTLYNWDVSQLTDGNYDLRVVSNCAQANKSSLIHTGIIDRINPHPFGQPSPADGILSPNDEIAIQFNESIEVGSINPSTQIDVRGVLNGGNTDHYSFINFDGSNDCLTNPSGLALQRRDFTFEFAAKRNNLGEQVIFSQGTSENNQLYIGFNDENKFVFRINNQEVKSTGSYIDSNWRYYAVSYDYELEKAELFVADGSTTPTMVNVGNTFIQEDLIATKPMSFGKTTFGRPLFFSGNLHDVRVWNYAKTLSQYSATRAAELSSSTLGLLHNWKMDEAEGLSSIDYVRRKDLELKGATWQVDPNGKSCLFGEQNNYVKISTPDVAITNEMNFTLEFWFNSNQNTAATLFSNGTGTGISSDSLYSWNIDKNADGKIIVKHAGLNWQATESNYFDGDWHHFALVLRRGSLLSCFVDGIPQSSISANNIKQLSGSNMYLGVRAFNLSGMLDTSRFFQGNIDDFRFWNLARTQEQLARDKRHRLLGDEAGLEVYLPFETYSLDLTGVPILQESFSDVANPSHTVTIINNPSFSNLTPTLRLPRPIQEIAFSYSVNNDKIIITPTTSPEIIENVTLDVTVQGIKDLRGNVMQSPATWIAYVDKNQVIWQDERFDYAINKNEELTFNTYIVNKGGAAQKFQILDIPSWLNASQVSGTLAPNSKLEIQFTVDPFVNLGDYEIYLGLLTDFNYPEKLNLNLKVNAIPPKWDVDPSNFEYNMNIIGLIKINDVISVDPEDRVAAFVGNELRGSSVLEYVPSIDAYRVFLNIYSNTSNRDLLRFKIWDASEGKTYSDVMPNSMEFDVNTVSGTVGDPIEFVTENLLTYDIPIRKGWNWLGFYLDDQDFRDLNSFLLPVAQEGNQIKSIDAFANCNADLSWTGSLHGSTLRPEFMYKLNSLSKDTMVLKGTVIDPSTRPIILEDGWNWIGFISLRNLSVQEALGNLTPKNGDILKSKSAFTVYNGPGIGWAGSLKTLIPGEGYMYKSNGSNNFTYPQSGMFENFKVLATRDGEEKLYRTLHENYSLNMTVTAEINNSCGSSEFKGDWAIQIRDGQGNIRARRPVSFSTEHENIYFTIAGDKNEVLYYELLGMKDNVVFDLDHQLQFKANDNLGSYFHPELIQIPSSLCREIEQYNELLQNKMIVYPSIVANSLQVQWITSHSYEKAEIRCTDMLGKTQFVIPIVLHEGLNNWSLDIHQFALKPGTYILEGVGGHTSAKTTFIKMNK